MFFKLVYNIGQQIRNPSLKKSYFFLKQSEKWSLEQLENYQFKKAKEMLLFSYENSVFYRQKFDALKFHPKSFKSLKDLKKIPAITKADLLQFNKEIHVKSKFKKAKKAITSGTSGESLAFIRDEFSDSFNRAAMLRGYSWYNVKVWEKNGYFWGLNFLFAQKVKTYLLDFMQHRFRLFSFKEVAVKKFIRKLKGASYLHGYSSMIYFVAKMYNENKMSVPVELKMIKGTSEKIFESYQNEVKKAFNLKIISEYGATETGIIAFECLEGNMHLNMEGCIVEEENNEIIVTNLQMKSFPIIRYKLGDYINLSKQKKCKCGRSHKILKNVIGRVGKQVYGKLNRYPSLAFYYVFKNLEKKNVLLTYRAYQFKKGKVLLKIEQKLSADQLVLLEKELYLYFTNDIDVTIQDFTCIDIEHEKQQSFISKIN